MREKESLLSIQTEIEFRFRNVVYQRFRVVVEEVQCHGVCAMDVVVGAVFHRMFRGKNMVLVFSLTISFINPVGQVFVIRDAHGAVCVAYDFSFHNDAAIGVAFALIGDKIAQ